MKKRGFTLIELLAVILILGIIALIAIPTVNKIIKESRKGAFESSISNLVGVIEDACQLEVLKGQTITTTYTFTNGVVTPSLNIKGNLPTSGSATVDASCNVALNVTNGKFTATKTSSADSVTVADGGEVPEPPTTYTVYASGTAIYFNPVTGAKCTAGEAVSTTGTKTGCMKWYTFNDGGASSESINLILDHNTTATVSWNSSVTNRNVNGPADVLTQLQTDTGSWAGVPTRTDSYSVSNGTATYTINYSTYKARFITAAEIAAITSNSTFNETTGLESNWFYLDSKNQTQTATTTGASNYDYLFDYTSGCTSYGCNIADESNLGYWTSTAIYGTTDNVWAVNLNGAMNSNNAQGGSMNGLRPVITISKSNI